MPILRRWHGRLRFLCGEMSSLATPVTADQQTRHYGLAYTMSY